jgi:hypothetical protein
MHLGSHACPLVAKLGVKLNDIALLIWRKSSFLKIWTQMVGPPQTAAFATTKETRVLLHGVPVTFPVLAHIRHQNGILGRRPRTFLQIPRIHEDLLWQIHDRYHQEQVSVLLPSSMLSISELLLHSSLHFFPATSKSPLFLERQYRLLQEAVMYIC